ncbi:MAG: chemotaxis protein CheW [Candidatus Obscuribacterales bacterium]|nr:chemotaxis protein CheW [Candidatus Obscuribacterales bacterium]
MTKADELEKRKILQERARLLARHEDEEVTAPDDEFYAVQFVVAGQNYAFDGPLVREVSHCKNLTRIPCTPPFIAGVVNIRSEIIPVLDTRKFFQLAPGWPDNSKLIILQVDDTKLGILVDDVVGVSTFSLSKLQLPMTNMTAEQTRYVRGIAEGPVIVIDAMALINDPTIEVNETVD